MWCTEQHVMDEASNAFSGPYVRQVINKCIEETPKQDQTNELWYVPGPKLFDGLFACRVKEERPADHDEHWHAPARDAIVEIDRLPFRGVNAKLIPIGTSNVQQHDRADCHDP